MKNLGIVMEFSELQPKNTYWSILITPSGMLNEVRAVHP